ncbi:MAG: FAD-dependent oxidoreductase [Deltaproteobacteria bacterium]|nr:FAD-dependent oxidoreductase [Deltaproteobacteria bacterium]MBW2396249.1 FAD-dependent oxidoreductase [Deltaproteobacteria bacterium]
MGDQHRATTTRRRFLKGIGGTVGAAAFPLGRADAEIANGPGARDGYDVIVIGGGFAGITAARELQHAGLRTLVLEARNRLGGRTFTTRVGGELFELGGTWVHSTQPHVFSEVNRYGLELVETQSGVPERAVWWDGERAREAGMGEMLAVMKEAFCAPPGGEEIDAPLSALQAFALLSRQMSEFHAGAGTAFPRPFDPFSSEGWKDADTLSIRDRLNELDLSADRAGLLEGVLGASAHGSFDEASFAEMLRWWALSGQDLSRYSDSVARYRLRDGTESLIQAMLADGQPDVRLATAVTEVIQDGEGVEIRTESGGRLRARAAIAALPMNVVANIRFTPALHPDKVAASRERHAGAGVKVYVRLRNPLPPTTIFAGESEPFTSIFGMKSDVEGAELVAFGTDPAKIDVHDRAAVQVALRRFLPEVEVVSTLAYDWNLDPYSLGTWCVLKKGQMTRSLAALREPHGLVHFAGGDIALGWRGFIDGAIESGNRVAHDLIARLEGRPEQDAPSTEARTAHSSEPVAFQQCAACHPTDASGNAGVGPNLRGIVDRKVGSDSSFRYSDAIRGRDHTWTDAELDAFLTDPATYAPGTKMPFGGLKNSRDRAAVIRFLRSLE